MNKMIMTKNHCKIATDHSKKATRYTSNVYFKVGDLDELLQLYCPWLISITFSRKVQYTIELLITQKLQPVKYSTCIDGKPYMY